MYVRYCSRGAYVVGSWYHSYVYQVLVVYAYVDGAGITAMYAWYWWYMRTWEVAGITAVCTWQLAGITAVGTRQVADITAIGKKTLLSLCRIGDMTLKLRCWD